jgi:hypothetical protein
MPAAVSAGTVRTPGRRIPRRALHPRVVIRRRLQNRWEPRCRPLDDRRRNHRRGDGRRRWRRHNGRQRWWRHRGGRSVAHYYSRGRSGRNHQPCRRGGSGCWRRRGGFRDRLGRWLRCRGSRTLDRRRRHSARTNRARARGSLEGWLDVDPHCDGQCSHSHCEDGGQRAAHQSKRLAAFLHVAVGRTNVGGVEESAVIAKERGDAVGIL